MTLTPSISVSEEFNDNIFSNNQDREWDFITSFTPALALTINRPDYQLIAGYSFSADVYARESSLSNAFATQNLVATGLYRLTPGLTVTASDALVYDRNANRTTSEIFSTGDQQIWTNTLTAGMNWQMTPRNSLRLSGNHRLVRFGGRGTGVDSDDLGVQSDLTHVFTPRFSGIIGYRFTYLDLHDDQAGQDSHTHSPTVGFSYALTPTLTATIRGGAAITLLGGETFVTPTGTASLVQLFSFGSATLQYDRGVSVAGGFGGTNDTQTVSGTLALSTLVRSLYVVLNGAYHTSESLDSAQTQAVDVQSFTLYLGARYQIAQYASLFGGYTFFRQRGGSSANQVDIDQNRVRVGLQFGYPFNFD
jgi:hypothetical protein